MVKAVGSLPEDRKVTVGMTKAPNARVSSKRVVKCQQLNRCLRDRMSGGAGGRVLTTPSYPIPNSIQNTGNREDRNTGKKGKKDYKLSI